MCKLTRTLKKSMEKNVSPGSDGFTVEFFKFCWDEIGHPLVRALKLWLWKFFIFSYS